MRYCIPLSLTLLFALQVNNFSSQEIDVAESSRARTAKGFDET